MTEITTTSLDSMITNLHLELPPIPQLQDILIPTGSDLPIDISQTDYTDLTASPQMDTDIIPTDEVSGVQVMDIPDESPQTHT